MTIKKNYDFDYTQYKGQILDILIELSKNEKPNPDQYRKIVSRHIKGFDGVFSKQMLIKGYEGLKKEGCKELPNDPDLLSKIQMKPTRTQSGVTPVTVLTKPFPCPGQCIFCPSDIRMPKSYMSDEPGAQRAARNKFDPYLQVYDRLNAFKNIGHSTSKIELIILGGSWSAYPESYQIWFIKRCFEAMNDFGQFSSMGVPYPLSSQERAGVRSQGSKHTYFQNLTTDPKAKQFAKELRKDQTYTENLLWYYLRNRRMDGYKFRRQHPIDKYIVDFYCHELGLIIEIDGEVHQGNENYDENRQNYLESLNFKFLRIKRENIDRDLGRVLVDISEACGKLEGGGPHPNPLLRGEGEELASGLKHRPGTPLETSPQPSPERRGSVVDFLFLGGEGESLQVGNSYNKIIREANKENNLKNEDIEKSTWEELFEQHKINESGECKCVGLVVETRPDLVSEQEVVRIRKLGCTKVQIGLQSLDNDILKKNKRGHSVEDSARAVSLLRQAGFKVHAHWMANLYGSDPKKDIEDYKKLFEDERFRPDELKIYPCSLVESADLMSYYRKGLWKPYSKGELLKVVTKAIAATPEYCRLTRVIRDIPSTDIVVGNKMTNFRQIAELELDKQKVIRKDIRSREIRRQKVAEKDLQLKIVEYKTSTSEELFLQYVTEENKIAGFLRLSLPFENDSFIPELQDCAIIREVHVYGIALDVGKKEQGKAQHLGLGTKLIQKAKEIVKESGYQKLAVISAIGTKEYYRKRGFDYQGLYQVTKIDN